ncbi:28S ribosomal protein S18c, mitochondrial-like [Pollicipes pollicipes]|uniref:28S ribosomal protein S18c, mitochondrial-like n=1 Tax=Pollicipes pollicipes TaxID=41117 RepID=UPI001885974E|nr:28S ribosomal protein S18c, mitochondrial-like [Pollicipes pollicipes]XP_037069567.1 28S ribosomal protein S18c, mitochondrial-like [Pollicipes pollicipes]
MSLVPWALALLRGPSRRLPTLVSARGEASSAARAPPTAAAGEAAPQPAAAAGHTAPSPDAPLPDMENPYQTERRQCIACRHQLRFDYKNAKLLSQFVSPFTGRMYGRHVTGLCAEQHRRLDSEYKKAVVCGYMGLKIKQVEFLRDPRICDLTKPVRPHRF